MSIDLKEILGEGPEPRVPLEYSIHPLSRAVLSVRVAEIPEIEEPAVENLESGGALTQGRIIESYNGVEIVEGPKGSIPIYNVLIPGLEIEDWMRLNRYKKALLEGLETDSGFIKSSCDREPLFSQDIRELIKQDRTTTDKGKIKLLFAKEIGTVLSASEEGLSGEKLDTIVGLLTDVVIGYGVLEFLLRDDQLEEIMILGEQKSAYVFHRNHGMCMTNIVFSDNEEILAIVNRMAQDVGRKIDRANPLLDARLRDGSRINATLSNITPAGATLTIRKFKKDPLTIIDIINNRTLSTELAAWLWVAIDGIDIRPANIIISGGTSSGKTTTLNSLATLIPQAARVISIEDTLELQVDFHDHWIQMETAQPMAADERSIDMNACLINTLRMRPDRIVIGEVRGKEAETLFTAMNTGHDGCMGTLHSNSSKETITRLTNPPMSVPMIMLPALDIIVVQNRLIHPEKGNIRRIVEVSEVAGMEQDKVLLNKLYNYNISSDQLESTGTPSRLIQDFAAKAGVTPQVLLTEIGRRKKVLEWLVHKKKRSIYDVKEAISLFNSDKETFLERISRE